ncbi:MAG: hypothetical protein ACI80S_001833 [Pseudohongiellaceae bacterium]|jgi:hypothetical protein
MKKSYRFAIQVLVTLPSILFSIVSAAHSGHGAANQFPHELEYLLWLVIGVSVLAYGVCCKLSNKI